MKLLPVRESRVNPSQADDSAIDFDMANFMGRTAYGGTLMDQDSDFGNDLGLEDMGDDEALEKEFQVCPMKFYCTIIAMKTSLVA